MTIETPDREPRGFTTTRSTPLWRDRDFRNLWIAETVSQAGSHISLVALPLLAIFVLDAAPSQMGFLIAAGTAPFLLIGLFVGVWVDRVHRRPLMIAADLLRGLLLMLIPLAWALDMLRIELLYAIALLTGSLTVVFDIAWQAILPSVVQRRSLVEANSKLQLSASVAQVSGPGAGGGLVSLIGAPATILVDAVSYIVSALFLFRMRSEPPAAKESAPVWDIWREIFSGLQMTYRDAILRPLIYSRMTVTFSAGVFFAVYVLFMVDDLGLSATSVGIVFGLGGCGSLLGAAVAERLSRRFGEGRTVVGGQFAFGAFAITLPLAVFFPAIALPMVVVSEFAQWMAHIIAQINELSIRQTAVDDRYLGRVGSVFQFFGRGLTPLGAIVGGILGELIGVPMTLVVSSAGFFVAFVFVLVSPLRGFRLAAREA